MKLCLVRNAAMLWLSGGIVAAPAGPSANWPAGSSRSAGAGENEGRGRTAWVTAAAIRSNCPRPTSFFRLTGHYCAATDLPRPGGRKDGPRSNPSRLRLSCHLRTQRKGLDVSDWDSGIIYWNVLYGRVQIPMPIDAGPFALLLEEHARAWPAAMFTNVRRLTFVYDGHVDRHDWHSCRRRRPLRPPPGANAAASAHATYPHLLIFTIA